MNNYIVNKMGFWSSVISIFLGVSYLTLLIYHFSTEGINNPTAGPVIFIGGIIMFLTAQVFIVLVAAIKHSNNDERHIYGSVGLVFIVLFAVVVSINRFIQLTVIQRTLPNVPQDLTRFLPYGEGSIMYSLEWLGWGFFSSLAAAFIAPLFHTTLLDRAIRCLFTLYAVFSLLGLIGFMTGNIFSTVAFIAWGPILLAISILLTIYFRNKNTVN